MKQLTPVQEKFVLHWGEMGLRWGINRTVAQIHALLYLAPKPLAADEICTLLGVARSNVSTSIRELQNWGIVKAVHVMGDRREFFESMHDVWEMFRVVLKVRKQREIDPTVAVLKDCLEDGSRGGARDETARERMAAMLEFFETMSLWYSQVDRLPTPAIRRFVKAGSKLQKLFGATPTG